MPSLCDDDLRERLPRWLVDNFAGSDRDGFHQPDVSIDGIRIGFRLPKSATRGRDGVRVQLLLLEDYDLWSLSSDVRSNPIDYQLLAGTPVVTQAGQSTTMQDSVTQKSRSLI